MGHARHGQLEGPDMIMRISLRGWTPFALRDACNQSHFAHSELQL